MYYLVCKGAKFSYFLLLLFAIPLIFEADKVLELWLVNVPEGAPLFMKLALIGAMVTVLGNSGYTACIATGFIKKYSIIITLIGSLNFIITWIAYKMGASVEMTYFIYIGVYLVVQVARLLLMKEMIDFPIMMYVKEVIGRIIVPSLIALVFPNVLCRLIEPSLGRTFFVCVSSVIWTGFCISLFGLTKGERKIIFGKLKSIINKFL